MTPRVRAWNDGVLIEQLAFPGELIVDSFAGGGGASLGIELALGRSPDIAINHDEEALALHAANHPTSKHMPEDVWKVDPKRACDGRPVGLMWLSPDCKHFSKAKGGKPVSKKIRSLAWVAIRWAKAVRPRVMVLENVEEFQDWGPVLRETNKPCPKRKGQTFRAFVRALERCGYHVEWRQLRACDFGAPTIRKRLFLIARCDGQPIQWPAPTHGKGRAQPWRTAAECIDWSIPCPSIFERKKELADNTLRRIARGIQRFVIDSPKPFIVSNMMNNVPRRVDEPLATITSGNKNYLTTPLLAGVGGRAGQSPERSLEQPYQTITAKADAAIITPHLVSLTHHGGDRVEDVGQPFATITGAHRGEKALIAPTLVQTGYGERDGQAPRSLDIEAPLGTIVGGGVKHALVNAFLAKHQSERHDGEVQGSSLHDAMPTIKTRDSNGLVAVHVKRDFGQSVGSAATDPLGTITGDGGGHASLVASNLVKLKGTSRDGQPVDQPMPTVMAGGTHLAEVRAFLADYRNGGTRTGNR
jgi:DNA (cytosine-5)-methyltransferase 1